MTEQPKDESEGRQENAATADYPGVSEVTPQDYHPARTDAAVERAGEQRSFGDATGNPQPPQGAGDGSAPASPDGGRTGPQGDPAEGKP
ncbi:MAG TPA: hypothetical protein VIE16_08910 [Phenylobacterium sp.]|jgi:hypothetical protein